MSTIQLFDFQQVAANTIADRFAELMDDAHAPTMTRQWQTFYYQALSALTGSGKTPILADAVAQMRAHLTGEPLVLWFSKHRVVVEQTLGNFQAGGKYENLIEGFVATKLAELRAEGLRDASTPPRHDRLLQPEGQGRWDAPRPQTGRRHLARPPVGGAADPVDGRQTPPAPDRL